MSSSQYQGLTINFCHDITISPKGANQPLGGRLVPWNHFPAGKAGASSWWTVVCSQCGFALPVCGISWAPQLPCPWLSPGVCSDLCPLSQWCYLTISSSTIAFSFCLQSVPASGSFPVSWLFTSGGQSIEASASASALPMNVHSWFPLRLTSLISLQSKGLSRVFSSTTVRKH